MENFASLTNTSVRDARAQWKDLSSRLMKLPRLSSEKPHPQVRDGSEEVIEDCIVVKGESGDESYGEDADGDGAEGGQKAKRKVRAKGKGKGKRVAKPSILESLEVDIEEEHNVGVADVEAQIESKGGEGSEPPMDEDRTKRAWDKIGDDMTEEKWNEMGDQHAL